MNKNTPSQPTVATPPASEPAPVAPASLLQYVTLGLVVIAVGLSGISLWKVRQIYNLELRGGVTTSDVFKRFTTHPQGRSYFGTMPASIVRVDQINFLQLRRQIPALDTFCLGNYLIEFTNTVFMYNYSQDKIIDFGLVPASLNLGSDLKALLTPAAPATRETDKLPK